MPHTLKQLSLIQDELKKLNAELVKYKHIFNSDGLITTEEQNKLDLMQDLIDKAEAKVITLGGGENATALNKKRKEMHKALEQLKAEMESMLLLYDLN